MPPAWAALLDGLALLATHQNNEYSPFHCEHDTLTVMAEPSHFTGAELAELEVLGFFPSGDGETFTSFRFGSA